MINIHFHIDNQFIFDVSIDELFLINLFDFLFHVHT